MNKEFIIFLSGPITGLSYEDSTQWRQDVQNKLPANIIPLSPLRNKEHLKREKDILDHYDHILSTSKSITKMDYFDVKRSDIILVNLLNTKRVSIGTVLWNLPGPGYLRQDHWWRDACGRPGRKK